MRVASTYVTAGVRRYLLRASDREIDDWYVARVRRALARAVSVGGLFGLIVACGFPFDRFGPHDAGPPAAPRARPGTPSPATAPAGRCTGDFQLALGPAVNATSPHLRERLHDGEQLAVGYIGTDLTRSGAHDSHICRVRVGLYQYRLGLRSIVLEESHDLAPTDTTLMQSWRVRREGEFEVVMTDATTRAVLAHRRFSVRASPLPPVVAGAPCAGTYDAAIGPAASPTSAALGEYLHPGEHLTAPCYVALEFTPHGASHFSACRMRFALYRRLPGDRSVIVESERDMSVGEGVFQKSWQLRQAGDFEIAVTDVRTGARLASELFTVD